MKFSIPFSYYIPSEWKFHIHTAMQKVASASRQRRFFLGQSIIKLKLYAKCLRIPDSSLASRCCNFKLLEEKSSTYSKSWPPVNDRCFTWFFYFLNSLLKHFPITSLFRSNSFYISIFFQECKIIFHCCFTNYSLKRDCNHDWIFSKSKCFLSISFNREKSMALLAH